MGKRHTLVHQLADWAERSPSAGAIFGKRDGAWKSWTWAEYWRTVRNVAKGLIALGHKRGECVAIVGDNRPEWVLYQFGIMAAGGIPAPIYTTNTQAQVAYIVSNSRARLAICDGLVQLEKYLACKADAVLDVEKILTMDRVEGHGDFVLALDQVAELGKKQADTELDSRLDAMKPEDTCLLIYTSGTTGIPKGVQLTHDGISLVGQGLLKFFPELTHHDAYTSVSYLPLCHIAEQIFTNILHMGTGGKVYFCPDLKELKAYLLDVRPTIFLGVPRVWEKFEAALHTNLGALTGFKAKVARWAQGVEYSSFRRDIASGRRSGGLQRKLAERLFISKLKQKLGLDRLVVAATGAAPISVRTQEFFAGLGICIYEGYGMSETAGVATVSDRFRPIFGSVGKALDGVQIKIAEDGEVLLKGRNMTRGYLHMAEATQELFDPDGWLQTGDLGRLDADGNLYITGRKKDLIITAGGKNIAPAELEAYIKTVKGVGQAVVVGDRQPYLAALISIDPEGIDDLCSFLGIPKATVAELATHPKVHEHFHKGIEDKCNSKVARYQTIKKFEVLPKEFTVEGDELTPTMKIKRNVIGKKYAPVIEKMYAAGAVEANA